MLILGVCILLNNKFKKAVWPFLPDNCHSVVSWQMPQSASDFGLGIMSLKMVIALKKRYEYMNYTGLV